MIEARNPSGRSKRRRKSKLNNHLPCNTWIWATVQLYYDFFGSWVPVSSHIVLWSWWAQGWCSLRQGGMGVPTAIDLQWSCGLTGSQCTLLLGRDLQLISRTLANTYEGQGSVPGIEKPTSQQQQQKKSLCSWLHFYHFIEFSPLVHQKLW